MTNPFLAPLTHKHKAIPFDQIQPEHFRPALEAAIAKGREVLEEIKAKPASFENTLLGLERCTEELEFVQGVFGNLLSAETNEKLQALAPELGPLVSSFSNDILLDPGIFQKITDVYNQRQSLGLNAEQLFYVEKVHRDFLLHGAALDETKKNRLRAIDERLAQLTPKFRDNVLKATNAFELWIEKESDLAGLPDSTKTAAREAAAEKGQPNKWLFTLHMPSYLPFMRFSENRALREKMYRAMNERAYKGEFDNQPVILEKVRLQHEKANLLGAKTYAQLTLQSRMAETPEQVMTFLDKLLKAALPAAKKELQEIQQLADQMGGPAPIQPWDFAYYSEKLKEKKYSFDEESLRPYFKLENVLNGVFETTRRLYNLTFKLSTEYPAYHKDVQVFEVYREGTNEFVALFYADFFPRPGKSQGAWMTNFREQGTFRGESHRPHVSIVCNFTKPTSEQPSLLTFDEVLTLFHEFGHALHGMLSHVQIRSLAGANVYWDFVELPSQIFENWAEEEETLNLFAFHYKTGEPIPKDLVQRLKASQLFLVGYNAVRQLTFGFLDMAWYNKEVPANTDVLAYERNATKHCQLLPLVDGLCFSTAFSHIFGGGYAAGYYSYKWAEALDADAFEYFKEVGIFDKKVAKKFEEHILSKGGSDHPMRLYENFRGRKPDPDALLRRDGLLT